MTLQIKNVLEENEGPSYIGAYSSDVDSISHIHGPRTEAERNQIKMIAEAFQRNLVEDIDAEAAEDTLLVITADHGRSNTVKR